MVLRQANRHTASSVNRSTINKDCPAQKSQRNEEINTALNVHSAPWEQRACIVFVKHLFLCSNVLINSHNQMYARWQIRHPWHRILSTRIRVVTGNKGAIYLSLCSLIVLSWCFQIKIGQLGNVKSAELSQLALRFSVLSTAQLIYRFGKSW